MFEAMGVDTGIDIDKLIAARAPLIAGLPGEPVYGMTPEAGLPKGVLSVLPTSKPGSGRAQPASASRQW